MLWNAHEPLIEPLFSRLRRIKLDWPLAAFCVGGWGLLIWMAWRLL